MTFLMPQIREITSDSLGWALMVKFMKGKALRQSTLQVEKAVVALELGAAQGSCLQAKGSF